MVENKEEIEKLFKKMLKDDEERAPHDKIYREDFKDFEKFKVQWKICGVIGYQIFEIDKITCKFGEKLEEPDASLVIRNSELALRLLKRELFEFGYGPGYKGGFKINYTEGWKVIDTEKGKKRVRISKPFVTARFNRSKQYHPFILSRIPIFRPLAATRITEDDIGFFVPINQSLGKFESQILPVKVFNHFIEKASNIVIMHNCGCRVFNKCQDHDKSIGCMYMGDDTLKVLITEDRGHVATKDEALERVKLAVDNGLIPLLGRAMIEAVGFGIEDTGHFLSMCFCCPCCCIDVKILNYASTSLNIFRRIDGLNVKVDENSCTGCGDCLEACVWNAMEMRDEKAIVNQKRCLGCGRCETACPSDAISIKINDSSVAHELINKLEAHIDVS